MINRRRTLALTVGACLTPTGAMAMSEMQPIWVLPSGQSWAYAEAMASLQTSWRQIGRGRPLVILKTRELPEGAPPFAMVALGAAALQLVQARVARDAEWSKVPVISALLQQDGLQAIWPHHGSTVTAALLDQPYQRYASAIRHAFPSLKRVGALMPAGLTASQKSLSQTFAAHDLSMTVGEVGASSEIFAVLKDVLAQSQILLLLPHPMWSDPAILQRVLIASYRQRVPVVAYSPALVKAGAIMALFASPQQVGKQVSQILRNSIMGSGTSVIWPPTQWADDFVIEVNGQVCHSLGLDAPSVPALIEAVRREGSAQ